MSMLTRAFRRTAYSAAPVYVEPEVRMTFTEDEVGDLLMASSPIEIAYVGRQDDVAGPIELSEGELSTLIQLDFDLPDDGQL